MPEELTEAQQEMFGHFMAHALGCRCRNYRWSPVYDSEVACARCFGYVVNYNGDLVTSPRFGYRYARLGHRYHHFRH